MNPHSTRQTIARLVVVLAFAAANLACALNLGGLGGGPTATPVRAICNVPDVIGKSAADAEKTVKELGLEFSKTEEYDGKTPTGQVVSQQPAGGTALPGCLGLVKVIVSKGADPKATVPPSPTPQATSTPAPTRTPAPTATPSGPTTSLRGGPEGYTHLLASEQFNDRKSGFKSDWDVNIASGKSGFTKEGYLEIQGEVTAVIGNTTWKNYRVYLRNVRVGYGLPKLTLRVRYQDDNNYVQASCAESIDGDRYWLSCTWDVRVNGKQVDIQAAKIARVCNATCNIEIEASGDSFRLSSLGKPLSTISVPDLKGGGFRLSIATPKQALLIDDIEVMELENGSPKRTLFRDTFINYFKDTSRSTSNVVDKITLDGSALKWSVKSKGVVPALVWPEPRIATLERFAVSVEASIDSNNRGAFGLIFRYLDNLNHYRFFVSSTGRYRMDAVFGGEVNDFIDWTVSDAIKIGKPNLVAITGSGESYNFYINGKAVLENWKDKNLKGGTFGFTAVGFYDDEEINAVFDNLEVYEPMP